MRPSAYTKKEPNFELIAARMKSMPLPPAFFPFVSLPLANSTDGEETSRRFKLVHYVGTNELGKNIFVW
jgi:hypothetical protein